MSLLTERSLLVRPSISVWSGEVLDRAASRETETLKEASRGQVKLTKRLIAKDAIFPIQQAADRLRRYIKAETLPWRWDGVTLLPTENFMNFTQGWRQEKLLFDGAVASLIRRWGQHVANGQRALGKLASMYEYPTAQAVHLRFDAAVEFFAPPDDGDFRANIGEAEAEHIRETMRTANEAALIEAQAFMWKEMQTCVGRIVTRLNEYQKDDKGKVIKGRINDSLIGNLRDLTSRLHRLNITKDPDIEAMRAQLESDLCIYEPDDLKHDDELRVDVRDKASSILDQLNEIMPAAVSLPS